VPTVHTAWTEVAGYAGTRGTGRFDIVIVIDVSGSTRWASGADVNGNGVVGTRVRRVPPWKVFEPSFYCSDPGDTVLDAERLATRRLIERLDPRRTRIGIISFSDLARPRGPLGSSHELLQLVLDDLADAFGAGPTNLAQATRLAMRMLTETGEDRATAPEPVVLILSDGYPTHPEPDERAAAEALDAARGAARSGVRITTFALGIGEPDDPDVFAEMARVTGGEHVRVSEPGDVVQVLPAIDLANVAAIEVENATTRESARALRVRPDGSYDAYVRLRPGENRLRVTARGMAGDATTADRVVVYDDTRSDPEEAERMRKEIEIRTVEIELERAARAGKQRRVIELAPVPDVPPAQ
jgi:Mg-chelatase subunit ChlD